MRADFSLDHYARLVEDLLARGYAVRGFSDADPAQQHLILRHDIDMSIEVAAVLAQRERALGASTSRWPRSRKKSTPHYAHAPRSLRATRTRR